MSAFLVVYDRSGKPLDRDVLLPMLEMLSHRGPDGLDYIIRDNLLISHHHLWITPEEFGRKQPFKSTSGNLLITFDGRIDNREELYKLIESDNTYLKGLSDPELFLLLYEKYGQSSFSKIIGPFSFLIADPSNKEITGARDPMAERGFCYYITESLFIAASEEAAILKHPDVTCKLDEFTLSHFFALEPVFDGSTFFENINDLPPGYYIRVKNDRFYVAKYYETPNEIIRYKNEHEYHDHYREILEKSVISRLRCITPVSIMLSGGIDSNSIAALAARNNPFEDKIKAISWTFDEVNQCDERNYFGPACEMYGIEKIQFNADRLWPLADFQTYFRNPNSPLENLYRNLKQRVYRLCSENNSRLIFNGWYADSYYTGYNSWLVELLKDGRNRQFISSLLWLIKNNKLEGIIHDPAFRKLFSFIRKFIPNRSNKDNYQWLTDYARAKIYTAEEKQKRFTDYKYPQRAYSMFSSTSYFSPSYEHFNLSSQSIELECPYTDIRLVNYMINLPAYELYQKGVRKYVAKRALSGLLPQSILGRNDNTSLTPLYIKGIRHEQRKTVMNILNSDNGWQRYVNRDWIYKTLTDEVSSEKNEVIIWNCISYSMWIENLKSKGIYKT